MAGRPEGVAAYEAPTFSILRRKDCVETGRTDPLCRLRRHLRLEGGDYQRTKKPPGCPGGFLISELCQLS